MKVFKFGGASVKHAAAVRNITSILKEYKEDSLWVVVSAMGKTTNALECVVSAFRKGDDFASEIQNIYEYHRQLITELFTNSESVLKQLAQTVDSIHQNLINHVDEDELYDRVVSLGEVISSQIIYQFLLAEG